MYSALTYIGSGTLEIRSDYEEDNGKTIILSNGERTFSQVIEDGKALFKLLPYKNIYTITLLNEETEEFNDEIVLNFGEYKVYELVKPEKRSFFSSDTGTVITTGSISSYTFTKDYDLVSVTVALIQRDGAPSISNITSTVSQVFNNITTSNISAVISGTKYVYARGASYILKDVKAGDTFSFTVSAGQYTTRIVEC